MNYKPETHKTRCGAPWRDLGDNLILVINDEGKRNVVGPIDEFGHFQYYCSLERNKDYDLIPVPHEHNLPTDLPMAAQWAVRLTGSTVAVSPQKPEKKGSYYYYYNIIDAFILPAWIFGTEMLADYPPEDSLHKRTEDGGWMWVPKEDK